MHVLPTILTKKVKTPIAEFADRTKYVMCVLNSNNIPNLTQIRIFLKFEEKKNQFFEKYNISHYTSFAHMQTSGYFFF